MNYRAYKVLQLAEKGVSIFSFRQAQVITATPMPITKYVMVSTLFKEALAEKFRSSADR